MKEEQKIPQMTPVPMRSDLGGRIRNIGRPKTWFMALAEGIQNSLDAIFDSKTIGSVRVEIFRKQELLVETASSGAVTDIEISDTGIGFTKTNFDSFCTPDSLLKHNRGGKGLGRLLCLQTFERIEGNSTYEEGGNLHTREFILSRETPELRTREIETKRTAPGTTIRLCGLRSEYASASTSDLPKIKNWLIEHFLPALVDKPVWLKELVIKDGPDEVDLTVAISGSAAWKEEFQLNQYSFYSSCYSVDIQDGDDQVRLVASGRVVYSNTRALNHYLPHLGKVSDDTAHIILVRSPFFDENVNDARNGVSFIEESSDRTLIGVTASEFRESLAESLQKKLGSRLTESDRLLKQRIENVVMKEAPYYRPLLSSYFSSTEFQKLAASVKEDEILTSLDTYKRRDAGNLRKESKRLAKLHSKDAEYVEGAKKLAEKIEAQKQVALAEYVSFRKIILDRLDQVLRADENGKAEKEREIHNLIFPQHSDTEATPGVTHQLWILDERLESHAYLASDRPLDGKKGDRPDLLIAFEHPGMFGSDPAPKAKGYERIALVEFKRALGNFSGCSTDELPHRQLMRYAAQIESEKSVHHATKRPIKVTGDARFYCYAVCELNDAFLERLRREEGFTKSPTGDGAFAVKNDGRYYMEYISLEKLLEDAKARNSAFFKRLGLEG